VAFQEVKPPAAAYPIVAAMLPKRYFLEQPPPSGLRLTVMGGDNIATTWDVDGGTAARLVSGCAARGLKVSSVPYEGPNRAAA
jgi:hypothetical protein